MGSMSETAFRNYLRKIEKAYQTGNAVNHHEICHLFLHAL